MHYESHVIRVYMLSQSASEKQNQEEKDTCAPQISQNLRFMLCSRDLDVVHAQRIMGFFILITHKSRRLKNTIA